MNVVNQLSKISKRYFGIKEAITDFRGQQQALKKLGIGYGSPSYKNGKYLRIVRPGANGGKRIFEYIGADPQKQEHALACIERGKLYDEIENEIQALFSAERQLSDDLARVDRGLVRWCCIEEEL